jgi:hypothetical protein
MPELIGELPHGDPAAVRSFEELQFINHIMGNPRWV